ncbi:pancreatic lipase-related protein 2 [Trichonephila clavipes]|nr:pancreatic lipase-related protein 2 [Trichonephila clavipes]
MSSSLVPLKTHLVGERVRCVKSAEAHMSPVGVVWKLGERVPAQVSTSTLDHGSKFRVAALNPSLTVCYGKLGCFSSGPPFQHPFFRPISVPPLPPELQKTLYFLYTRPNNDVAFVFSALQLELALVSNFNPSKPTRILIHGVTDGVLLSTWMRKNLGASPEGFHLVGHGLGAHIAGYAGERLHNLGRITGLDPGAAYFRNAPDIVKLNPTDALFVDVIHSSPGRTFLEGLGTIEDIGNVNFSPGRPSKCLPQKTLSNEATAVEVLQNTFFCRHFRSIEYFLFSFNQKGCFFVGAECSSWEEFYVGRCNCGDDGSKCRFMGQFATSAPYEKRYYLVLGNNRPYCLHQYQVKMHLELPHLQKFYGPLKVSAHLAVIGESNFRETLHFRELLELEGAFVEPLELKVFSWNRIPTHTLKNIRSWTIAKDG